MEKYDVIKVLPSLQSYFTLVEIIAKGSNSNVWLVTDYNNNPFACKIPTKYAVDDLLVEGITMAHISKEPNNSPFLTFYGLYSYDNKPVILSELFQGFELSNLDMILNEPQLLHLAKELYGQVAYLNNLGMCHGDIHRSNILYNERRIVLIDITGQQYNKEYPEINAEVTRTTLKYWDKAINNGYDPNKLLWKKDIFDLGDLFRSLIVGTRINSSELFMIYPHSYRIKTEYPLMDTIVNSSIELDISLRPSAIDIVNYINEHS